MKLKVRYVDINTGEEIEEVVDGEIKDSTIIAEGTVDDRYETELKEFNKYITSSKRVYYKKYFEKYPYKLEEAGVDSVEEYMEKENINPSEPYIPENAKGTLELEENEDGTYNTEVIVTYYYAAKRKIVVKYVDQNTGEEIENEEIKQGPEGDVYDITDNEKELEGYTLVEIPKETEVEFADEDAEVTYYYAKNTDVSVKYVDEKTGESIDENANYEIKGYVGKEYKANKKDFDNYQLTKDSNNTEGTMTLEEQEVVYYYKKLEQQNNYQANTEITDTGSNSGTSNNPSSVLTPSTITITTPSESTQNINITKNYPVTEKQEDKEERTIIERITKPKTGDMVPVIAYSTILVVLVLNIIVYYQNNYKLTKLKINNLILEDRRRKNSKSYKNKVSKPRMIKDKNWVDINKYNEKKSKGKFIK